ncbi:hypothetical protein IG631_15701 [Alternaria alternata]|nr:hypothetical protein IG631_15701 [Alternaria alternata]
MEGRGSGGTKPSGGVIRSDYSPSFIAETAITQSPASNSDDRVVAGATTCTGTRETLAKLSTAVRRRSVQTV